mmetsp:Transcript_39783/g.67819  ORF Transcript_39783/g.67819 Transcript_39783/m.67819 type:complete len:326 (-) Transcript_39783:101-1078(-)
MSPETTRTSHTHLYLVADQDCTSLIAQLSCQFKVFARTGSDASLTLQWFQHDGGKSSLASGGGVFFGGGVDFVHELFQGVQVIIGSVFKAAYHFSSVGEAFVVLGLGCGCDGGEGTSVERLFSGDDHRIRNSPIASMPPRQLNRRLITLRTRITKERLIGTRILAQPRGQLTLLRRIIQIANVMQLRHLIGHGLGEGGVVVAQGAGGNAGNEIEVGFAGFVLEGGAGAGDEGDGIAAVCFLDAGFEEGGGGGGVDCGGWGEGGGDGSGCGDGGVEGCGGGCCAILMMILADGSGREGVAGTAAAEGEYCGENGGLLKEHDWIFIK